MRLMQILAKKCKMNDQTLKTAAHQVMCLIWRAGQMGAPFEEAKKMSEGRKVYPVDFTHSCDTGGSMMGGS